MLVVLAIIALLVAVLLPMLGAARRSARAIQCASNMRTIGLAMHSYADANRGVLPYGFMHVALPNVVFHAWDDLVDAGIGGDLSDDELSTEFRPRAPQTLHCPEDELVRSGNQPVRSYSMIGIPISWPGPGSYTCLGTCDGSYFGGAYFSLPYPWTFKLASLHRPSELLLVAEAPSPWNWAGGQQSFEISAPSDQTNYLNNQVPLHTRKWNYLFADGHVSLLAPKDTVGHGPAVPYLYGTSPGGEWTRSPDD